MSANDINEPMNHAEATSEARRRWGSEGWASLSSGLCAVGCGRIVAGEAFTWEDAFALAEGNVRLKGYLKMWATLERAKRLEVA